MERHRALREGSRATKPRSGEGTVGDSRQNWPHDDRLIYNWDPKTGNVVVPQEALSKVSPYYPKTINVVAVQAIPDLDMRDFAPRIGVAYRLRDKVVFRGGYGIFNEFLGP